jgi:hypothetical protein
MIDCYRLRFLLNRLHRRVSWNSPPKMHSMARSRDNGGSIRGTHRGLLLLLLIVFEFIHFPKLFLLLVIGNWWRELRPRFVVIKMLSSIGWLIYIFWERNAWGVISFKVEWRLIIPNCLMRCWSPIETTNRCIPRRKGSTKHHSWTVILTFAWLSFPFSDVDNTNLVILNMGLHLVVIQLLLLNLIWTWTTFWGSRIIIRHFAWIIPVSGWLWHYAKLYFNCYIYYFLR